jgi:uncharacterized protein
LFLCGNGVDSLVVYKAASNNKNLYCPQMTTLLTDQTEQQRYAALQNNQVVAFAEYRATTGALMLTHTEVNQDLEGQGVGSSLIEYALKDIRTRGLHVVPMCPFVVAYIKRHRDEYIDLVAAAHRNIFGL